MTDSSALGCQGDRFTLPPGAHYLNCAYMSPLSKRVQEAGISGVRQKGVPTEIRTSDFFRDADAARALFAGLIGAEDSARIAIIPAASYGLATVARNTPVGRGQNVVTVHEQFPSNVHSWRRACESSGGTLRPVRPPTDGPGRVAAWNDAICEAIDGDTAAVALGPIHWADGTRFDLERVGARAREVGAAFIVDGTQCVGAEPFDVQRIQPDALVCAAYKWLMGPYSIGAAYFGSRYSDGVPLEESWLAREGSDDFAALGDQGDAYRPGAIRYDVGEVANFILLPMFIAALEDLLEWGVPRIAAYIKTLTEALVQDPRLDARGLGGDVPDAPHLFALKLPENADPNRVKARLRERGVFVSVRGRAIRVSPHIYNDSDDVDAFIEALSADGL